MTARSPSTRLSSRPEPGTHHKDQGVLATIGRSAAEADVYGVKLSGFVAWLVWLFIHIMRLEGPGMKHRFQFVDTHCTVGF